MTQSTENIQLMFNEIAMSIGSSLDLYSMLKESLSTYLRKLNCAAGGVFMLKSEPAKGSNYTPVITTPRSLKSSSMFLAISKQLQKRGIDYESVDLRTKLPLEGCVDGFIYYHLNELPGFGYILLIKNNEDLDPFIVKSLRPLNAKLAGACLSCLQKTEIENINKRLSDILMSSEDLVWETDAQGKYIYISHSCKGFLGYEPGEMLGKNFWDFMSSPEAQRNEKNYAQKISKKESYKDAESWMITKEGRQICVLTNGVPVIENDKVIGYRGVNKDITLWKYANAQLLEEINERKKTEQRLKDLNEKLEQSNKELKGLTYISSHDLREPLRKVIAFTELIEDSLSDKLDPDDKENLSFIIEGASRMQQMIKALRDYSQVISECGNSEDVDLNDLVDKVKKYELANDIEETGTNIQIQVPLHHVRCDYKQIRQVIESLLSNGIKYCKNNVKPEITISSKLWDGGFVRVDIKDNGIGIKQEDFKNLFIIFKRIHCNIKNHSASIGLAICKRIIEQHGGNIGVSSTYGEGSTFWFTVPAVTDIENTA